jgi:hypothetical protein
MAVFDPAKPHMCRDYSKVFPFAEKWRVYDGNHASERKPLEDKGNRVIKCINLEDEDNTR